MSPRRPIASRSRAGITLLEVIFSIGVFSVIAFAAFNHIGLSWSFTRVNKDRIFAFRKAQFILAELQAYVDTNETNSASDLDRFDNGTSSSAALTITEVAGKPVAPDHPASMNSTSGDGDWKWSRRITVRPFPGQNSRDVRFVTVRMFRNDAGGRERQLAEVSSVIRSVGQAYPTTQEYDVYLLALENVPGWWVYLDSIRPFIEATLGDLEARNPGLRFRTHWITKLGYGRDPYYTPYVNEASATTADIPSVYFYPGRLPDGLAAPRYYVATDILARKNVDGTIYNDMPETPFPYTLADQWNHCMRLPDAKELFQQRLAVGLEERLTPTWQILLNDLITYPEKYHNAIFVNLHGELLPMPPLRNYSDAARDPETHPGIRVVTHPEQLRYDSAGTRDVKLRVYAYQAAATPCTATVMDAITVRIGGLTLPDETTLVAQMNAASTADRPVLIERIGVFPGYTGYQKLVCAPGETPAVGWENLMHADQVRIENGELVITLRETPLRCPSEVNGSGLGSQWKLYGMEYVPSPVEAAADFSQDLTSTVSGPKNTARWVITIRTGTDPTHTYLPTGDETLCVTTALGTSPGSLLPSISEWVKVKNKVFKNPKWKELPVFDPLTEIWDEDRKWKKKDYRLSTLDMPAYADTPTNNSKTYVYWTQSIDDVPFTERYQFLGDPRHCPYADLRENGVNFPNGFNWFFDDLSNGFGSYASSWGFTTGRLRDGWMGRLEIDVARYFQTLREALVRAETLYSTLTGWSYYYMGIGNEIGYDSQNGFPNSIPVHGRPFGKESSGTVYDDSISSGGDYDIRGVKLIREAATANYWWSIPWLGEIAPDHAFATWQTTGNLPAGDTSGRFKRVPRQSIAYNLPLGTTFAASVRRTASEGCTSFFNIGTASATFHHRSTNGQTGSLTSVGEQLAQNYNFNIPSVANISRPFHPATDTSGGVGPEFTYTSDYPRYTAQIVKTYYDHQAVPAVGSALLELQHPTLGRSGYIVMNGLDCTVESGSAFIAKYSLLALMQSLFEAGDGSLAHPVARLPRVVIRGPTAATELINPTSIDLQWECLWTRWDARPYTGAVVANSGESESNLVYALLYSADGGATWHNVVDDSPAMPGERPENPAVLVADQQTGAELYAWSTPEASVPAGSYLIRVEVYRTGEELHVAHHTEKIFIDRR